MYGDFLVPENTNVNNAITTDTGAKWEKFDSIEFDENVSGELLYYDEDKDGTPLNLNGVMIICKYSSSVSTTHFIHINSAETTSALYGYGAGTANYETLDVLHIKNGAIMPIHKVSQSKTTVANLQTVSPLFIDNIHGFGYRGNFNAGDVVDFYVLRSV